MGACAYAYVYAFVPSPPRPPATRSWPGRWWARWCGRWPRPDSFVFADLWPGYDTTYGVFATLIVAVVWLWLTNVSVLLGGAFALEWARGGHPDGRAVWEYPAHIP